MKTLFENDFCEIKRTADGRLLRVDKVLETEMYVASYFNHKGNIKF